MLCYVNRCNSISVESGCFMVYEQPHYKGQQYLLRKGDYPEYDCWMGKNDSVCSCRVVPMVMIIYGLCLLMMHLLKWQKVNTHLCPSVYQAHQSSHEVKLFERMEYGGQMMNLGEDCPSVMDRFHTNNIFSCKVIDGNWLFYEHSNYRGRMYLIRPGEYARFTEWGGRSARVGSIKRILDS